MFGFFFVGFFFFFFFLYVCVCVLDVPKQTFFSPKVVCLFSNTVFLLFAYFRFYILLYFFIHSFSLSIRINFPSVISITTIYYHFLLSLSASEYDFQRAITTCIHIQSNIDCFPCNMLVPQRHNMQCVSHGQVCLVVHATTLSRSDLLFQQANSILTPGKPVLERAQ